MAYDGKPITTSLDTYEPLLESCAETGQLDYSQWPLILPPLLERLDRIAHNDFPVPRPYPIINPVLPSQSEPERSFINEPPTLRSNTPNTPRTLPPVPPFPSISNSRVLDAQIQENDAHKGGNGEHKAQLPPEVLQLLEQSLKALRTSFAENPPHTIQRLSELVLYPRKHYRTLPAWLRALDRVVSVSSGANIFPLSDVPPNVGSVNGLINGTEIGGILFANPSSANDVRNGYDRDALGSDESLGGALLTPIPWLKHSDIGSGTDTSTMDASSKVESWQEKTESPEEEMLPLPDPNAPVVPDVTENFVADAAAIQEVVNGHDSEFIPGRPDGGVTQGELIRMEQEAGIVPVPHEDIHRIGDGDIEIDDDGDNMPDVHARGPDLVGTVDMGKVGGQERTLRISSPPDEMVNRVDVGDAQEVLQGGVHQSTEGDASDDFVKIEREEAIKKASTSTGSDDGDIVLVDADGTMEGAPEVKKETGPDAADATTQ